MTSLRMRLFALLLLATGLIWLSAVVWLQYSTKAQIERVLDSRLAEAGHMVSSLLSDQGLAHAVSLDAEGSLSLPDFRVIDGGIERQLHCQVWSMRGTLLGQSGGGPAQRLAQSEPGFSASEMDGGKWRVYTVVNEALGVEIVVGESYAMRENLVADVRAGLIWPILVIAPLLAAAIWLSAGRGLRPLQQFASALAARDEGNLDPVAKTPLPPEMCPVGTALDGLLSRLAQARRRERDFIAYAAHELKTPLAGIKTQAQVARSAPPGVVQDNALEKLTGAVDRTGRLVGQLLDLARAEDGDALSVRSEHLDSIARRACADAQDLAQRKGVTLRLKGSAGGVCTDPVQLGVALRNVLENALHAAPAGSVVTVLVSDTGVDVHDQGAGIAADDLPHVTQRFFTGAGAREKGSGLGLAIAAAALNKLGWRLEFRPAHPQGQIVRLLR
ncbi:ATP-binding protein [Roseinatronobacter sp. S2]|uniref:ATP-binding protein n=1 Tax=Roseinatronobacter sp. S2 TaxID=3035471 RepID=UPI0024100D9F|nr:ATP-binding protein [Roseinatronobacter sp. S2]WFE76856.1 histidine kinase dimerization/phospho-acceptor domain-containing protein [Roseinatronobacter sp. S2]